MSRRVPRIVPLQAGGGRSSGTRSSLAAGCTGPPGQGVRDRGVARADDKGFAEHGVERVVAYTMWSVSRRGACWRTPPALRQDVPRGLALPHPGRRGRRRRVRAHPIGVGGAGAARRPIGPRSRARGSRSPRTASAPARSGRDRGARCSPVRSSICELHRDPEAIAVLRADLGEQLERLDARNGRELIGRIQKSRSSADPCGWTRVNVTVCRMRPATITGLSATTASARPAR